MVATSNTGSGSQVNTQSTSEVKLLQQPIILNQSQFGNVTIAPQQAQIVNVMNPGQQQIQQIVVSTSSNPHQQPIIIQQSAGSSMSQQQTLIPATIQQQIVSSSIQSAAISTAPVQQSEISSTVNQLIAPKPTEENQHKTEDQNATTQPATNTINKSFSIQIPLPSNAQSGGPQHTVKVIPAMDPNKVVDEEVDPSWPYVCDWRGCPK